MSAVAAGIIAGGALINAGIDWYSSQSAQKKQFEEHRRTEALNIKFAEKEAKREESRFGRTLGLQKKQQAFTEKQHQDNLNESARAGILGTMTSFLGSDATTNSYINRLSARA